MYPSLVSRIFNLCASTFFLYFPLENIVDGREYPLEEHRKGVLGFVGYEEPLLFSLYQFYNSIIQLCRLWYIELLGPSPPNRHYSIDFISSVVSARVGLICINNEHNSEFDFYLTQWEMGMAQLTESNFQFSWGLKKEWLNADNRINDPCYKILDDWLANIYHGVKSSENEKNEKIQECRQYGSIVWAHMK